MTSASQKLDTNTIYEFNFQFVGSEFTAQGPGFENILFACT